MYNNCHNEQKTSTVPKMAVYKMAGVHVAECYEYVVQYVIANTGSLNNRHTIIIYMCRNIRTKLTYITCSCKINNNNKFLFTN